MKWWIWVRTLAALALAGLVTAGPAAPRALAGDPPAGRPSAPQTDANSKEKPHAPKGSKAGRDPETLKKNLERWKSMSPEQRAEMQKRNEFLKKCSPQQRQALMGTYRSFMQLPPDQRAILKSKLASLPPEAQKALKKQFEKMRNSPEARAMTQGLFMLLRDVPKERFKKIEELPPAARGQALRKLIAGQAQARYLETLPAEAREAWKKKRAVEKRADIQGWLRKFAPAPGSSPHKHPDTHPEKPDKSGSDGLPHREPASSPPPARSGSGEFW